MNRLSKSFVFLVTICGLVGAANAQHIINGTYQLDAAKSENVADIVERATRGNRATSADRQDLASKLEAPQTISIDVRGKSVTLSTSASPSAANFTADGKSYSSNRDDGSTVSIRATLRTNSLIVSSFGGDTDYTLTFESVDNGRGLNVTRRITTPYLQQTIFADSFYDRTDSLDRSAVNNSDDGYSSSDSQNVPYGSSSPSGNSPPTVRAATNGKYIVPRGIVLYGKLNNVVDTKASQVNDRISMTVQTPREFEGAVVEGYLSDVKRSGRVTGSANFTMTFETIRLRNGKVYDFAGVLQSATDVNGKQVKVSNEGELKGDSKGREAVKRGGIGAGIGAILGGILGGGKGAIIGATIGGGAGSGSVIATGKGDVRLQIGSEISVESTSP